MIAFWFALCSNPKKRETLQHFFSFGYVLQRFWCPVIMITVACAPCGVVALGIFHVS
jgi:hypothetical protein